MALPVSDGRLLQGFEWERNLSPPDQAQQRFYLFRVLSPSAAMDGFEVSDTQTT